MPTLRWLTRDDDVRAIEKVPYRLLEEIKGLGYGDRDAGNMLIQGDNLEALKALLPYYAGQVKCIYIDPPYNTQQAISEHYDDNIEHSQWLGIMWPRLQLMRELLTTDGYIAVQIDDRQFARLYVLLCEIFGERTLKPIVVKMSEASGLKMGSVRRSGRIPKLKEFILFAKMDGIRNLRLDPVPKQGWDKEYNIFLDGFSREDKSKIDEILQEEEILDSHIAELDEISSRIRLGSVAEKTRELGLSGKTKETWLFENAFRICQCATSASVLALADEKYPGQSPEVFSVKSRKGETAYLVRGNYSRDSKKPRVQLIFAEDNLSTHPGDLWLDIRTTGLEAEGQVAFKNGKKPEQLVRRVIAMATEPGDLVMDAFAGSGTTPAVAQKMGRRWIAIERGEQATSHCVPRLSRVVGGNDPIGVTELEGWQGGGGFRFYRLGPPVFTEDGQIQPDIRFPVLAAHIWFAETGNPWTEPQPLTPFLGAHDGKGYALLYNGILGDKSVSGGNVLTRKTLATIRAAQGALTGPVTVYGERTALSEATLKAEQIEFKQTPYDVKARK